MENISTNYFKALEQIDFLTLEHTSSLKGLFKGKGYDSLASNCEQLREQLIHLGKVQVLEQVKAYPFALLPIEMALQTTGAGTVFLRWRKKDRSVMGVHLGESKKANQLLKKITGFNQKSIIAACKLVGYDTAYRAGPSSFIGIDHITPDKDTLANITMMLERCLSFFKKYGPVTETGTTFLDGYTDIIKSGDADFLTHDTLWDMKVIKSEPTSQHTLQLIIYYLLMCRSVHDAFDSIKNIGIFNPRKNAIYLYPIDKMDESMVDEVQLLMCFGKEALKKKEQKRTLEIIEEIMILNVTNVEFKKIMTMDGMILFLKNHFTDFSLIYNKPYDDFKSKITDALSNIELKYKKTIEALSLIGVGKELAELFIIHDIHSVDDLVNCASDKLVELIKINKPNSTADAFARYLIEKAQQINNH